MEYIFTLLEGIASFISPCLLPMIPIYIAYFIGEDNHKLKKGFVNAICFVLGFTLIFVLLSIFASCFGYAISNYMKQVKIVFGAIIIVFGLNYMDLLKIGFINKMKPVKMNVENMNIVKSFLFGMLFSISWTPCIGTFLSSALILIASKKDLIKGIFLMILYSAGLGIPFIVSVVLMEKIREFFSIIKQNYDKIKKIAGIILIIMGIYIIFF